MRTALVVCTTLLLACDSRADADALVANAKLAARDREIVELRAELAKATPASPTSPTTTPTGPGQLDPEFVRIAATARKLELELEADGSVRKLAVYHDDAGDVPAAVTARASAVFPGATIRSYESEFYRDLGRVFEVEVETADKQHCEVSARADGTLVYKECELAAKALPAEITAALAREAPGRTILEVERKDHADGKVEFVAEVGPPTVSPSKPKPGPADAPEELYFDAAGKLLRREVTLAAEVEITRP